MTISASDEAADGDRLERALELYRDLSVALRGQIEQLKAGTGRASGAGVEKTLEQHRKALQSVRDAEAGLVERKRAGAGEAGAGLDLEAARAEILARLAVRAAPG